ncbi:type IV pilus modification protein PilV [uncultured Desulfobulbus sp.]|uniref:type IV pilus modification protein PilV n=1 Tax=uncultured Desulfobulbus sp. TaxID=239745 RepID=UPI0029C6A2A3|nr:type IV pilus modification protein PilV [uncultured Desulfobulbus sp.]
MQNPFSKMRSQQGFTLIEVLMAMVILGIGIMSIVALQTQDMTFNNSSRRQTQGSTWAMDRVERLRSLPYTDAALSVAGNPHTENIQVGGKTVYSLRWIVSDNTANVPDTKKVDVTIQSNGRNVSSLTFIRTLSAI